MKKISSMFVCQECGYESTSWLGKCPECGNWNSLKEFQQRPNIKDQSASWRAKTGRQELIEPKTLDQISYSEKERMTTGFSEMDTVMGGGIVRGSVILLAGDPGIGKSTLLLQAALNIANGAEVGHNPAEPDESSPRQNSVLYISGEESEEQIKLRANRITNGQNQVKLGSSNQNFLLLSITDTDAIVSVIEKIKPSLVIIDSIQTVESANTSGLSGSVAQVRYSAFSFIRAAKTLNIPVIIVGHVTKEGMVAGPMILSHMVDTVLFLEGEKFTRTRILRSLKNRFGPIDEVGVFSMEEGGITEIKNPEQIFMTQNKKEKISGSSLAVIMEGTRPFLIEIQSLVNYSKLPIPRHVCQGVDYRRLELLLAVMQKHCNLSLQTMDIFVNIAGGIKVTDPAVDLGICLSIFSSFKNVPLIQTIGIGEIGLLGELREVSALDKRVKEAKKLGFDRIVSVKTHKYLNEVLKTFSS